MLYSALRNSVWDQIKYMCTSDITNSWIPYKKNYSYNDINTIVFEGAIYLQLNYSHSNHVFYSRYINAEQFKSINKSNFDEVIRRHIGIFIFSLYLICNKMSTPPLSEQYFHAFYEMNSVLIHLPTCTCVWKLESWKNLWIRFEYSRKKELRLNAYFKNNTLFRN